MGDAAPREQFEATEYDDQGNIITPPAPPAAEKRKRTTVADLKKELDELKSDVENDILGWLGELATRLDTIEHELKPQSEQGAKFVWDKLNNQDVAIGAIAKALRSHLEEATEPQREPPAEIEFAAPPQQTAGGQIRTSNIAEVASACQVMTDVLMICRALKTLPELTDQERNEILNIACRYSGVIITPGLQIRAGVKFTGA